MGFPLPDDPDVTDLAYFLVAIPDDPVFRRAIKGWYSELGKPYVWGLEGVTSGSYVAAQSWLRAIDETWRLIEMGWPDLVISHIDDIEALLTALQNALTYTVTCCNDNLTTQDPPGGGTSGEDVPQPIIDAGYATGVSDQAGYTSYKCMAAHLLINNFQAKLVELAPIATAGGALLSVLLILFGAISGITGLVLAGLVIGLGDILALIDALKDLGAGSLTSLAQDLEDNREDIVCAILSGDGIEDAIAQFDAKIDELFSDTEAAIINALNVRHMFQLLLYGEHGNVDIAAALAAEGYDPADYTCSCEADISALFTFDTDAESWSIAGTASWYDTWDCLDCGNGVPDGTLRCTITTINTLLGSGTIVEGNTYRFRTIRYLEGHRPDNTPNPGTTYGIYLAETGSGVNPVLHSTESTVATNTQPDTIIDVDVSEWPDFVAGTGTHILVAFSNPSGNGRACFDNVLIELDDVTP